MRCGYCLLEWCVNSAWLDRFHQALESCPRCGTDCQSRARPNFWADRNDPAYDDAMVRELYWYHSSVHVGWPDKNFDPTAALTAETKQRFHSMSLDGKGLERWSARQKTKALHLGTYESAIENMFRRMRNQDSSNDQFHLYRVRLKSKCIIEAGVHPGPTNFVGDAHLADVCGPDTTVFRYVNTHEDPSSISLAVDIKAIHAVKQIPIPLPIHADEPWIQDATSRLLAAVSRPAPLPRNAIERIRPRMPSALSLEADKLTAEICTRLPLSIFDRFHVIFDEAEFARNPSAFPVKLLGLAQLVTNPQATTDLLDSKPWQII